MEDTLVYLVLLLLLPFLLVALKSCSKTRTQHKKNLPPSPPSLPIIGHLHLVKRPLHRTLDHLSQKYGKIISLRFGSQKVVVVSSPSAVEECLTKNDTIFANRPPLSVFKHVAYNNTTLGTACYSNHWRNIRRIGALEVFSSNRLNAFTGIRREEIKIFLNKLYSLNTSCDFVKVKLNRQVFMEITFNIIMRMVAGKRYYGEDVKGKEKEQAEQFIQTTCEIFEYGGASYLGDFLPILQWIDYGGYLKKVKSLGKRTDRLLQGLIDEHRVDRGRNTMISHLLSLQESQPEYYTDEIIKSLMLDIILAASETSAVTLEWAMSSILKNPEILEKAKKEVDMKVGEENLMDESDNSKLPYIQNIITETLRLYPPAPLLVPHLSSQECSVGGYHIEPNTMLLLNAWAMQRDLELWDDSIKFRPERFESPIGPGTESYKLIPFGLGRRSCPGMGLANRFLGFTLGCMIQCFEWKKVDGQDIDMAEGNCGLTMPRAETLEAMCKPRNIMKKMASS